MNIIAGRYRGRKLKAPKGLSTRPVLGRVREALFNILGDIVGERFLDLFAGTGAIGIEALSRGAEPVILVELDTVPYRIINDNIPETETDIRVLRSDALRALERFENGGEVFDIIFADPPYERDLSRQTVERVGAGHVLADDGLLVVTSRSTETLPEASGTLVLSRERRYGDTRLWFYRLRGK